MVATGDVAVAAQALLPVPVPVYTITFAPGAAPEVVDRLFDQNPTGRPMVSASGGTVFVTFQTGFVPNLNGVEGRLA